MPLPAPKLSSSSLTGLAAGAPRLAFEAVATSGAVKTIKVTLPAGVTSRSAALSSKYLTVTSAGKAVSRTVTRTGSTLLITVKGSAKSVTVVISSKALAETATLKKSVMKKRTIKLKVAFTLTNSVGATTQSTVSVKV